MKKQRSIVKIIIVVFVVTFTIVFLVYCRKQSNNEFRITGASFTTPVVAGRTAEKAPLHDFQFSYSGHPQGPLKMIFYMVSADQKGEFNKVESPVNSKSPVVLFPKFYKFWGFRKSGNVTYELVLQEDRPGGRKTAPYRIPVHVNAPM